MITPVQFKCLFLRNFKYEDNIKNINFEANPDVFGVLAIGKDKIPNHISEQFSVGTTPEHYVEFFTKYLTNNFPICVEYVDVPFDENEILDLKKWKGYDAIITWVLWKESPLLKHIHELPIIRTSNITVIKN